MGAAENKAAVTGVFSGAEGAGTLLDLLAEDVEWTIFGETMFSATYRGKTELQERLWGRLFQELAEPFGTVIDLVLAEGEHVVVQMHATNGMAKSGVPYNNQYCIVFTFDDGKVVKADEYMDTELVTKAFGPPPTV